MKKYLLPENGNFYKANLHCHSTISDGKKTPEELKKIYTDLGYSVIAYTDHDILIAHNDLSDENFLALNGFELEINEPGDKPFSRKKCCHICFIALDKKNTIQPMWNEKYLFGGAPQYKHLVKADPETEGYEREYTGEAISKIMKIGKEKGFFVTYNHPTWSKEIYPEYINYNNMDAFEMFNGGCIAAGYDDYNPRVYDDLLSAGKKIFCIGADDNHNAHDENTRDWDSGYTFTAIKSPSLKYEDIANALKNGEFYCSEGPEIEALWIENGKIHVKCSPADRIICNYEIRKAGIKFSEHEIPVTEASFEISKDYGYARITVIDKKGYHACTNAYYEE